MNFFGGDDVDILSLRLGVPLYQIEYILFRHYLHLLVRYIYTLPHCN